MAGDIRALPPILGGISADLKEIFGPRLRSYVEAIRHLPSRPKRPKVINDSIWKTVRLEPWEMVVLDSFPIQRLRNVAQLGLARLVYPGAGYSRFEHSIGVLYQTQRIIDSINHNARSSGRSAEPISRSDESLLRLAGLLHDIGHGFLSHVSERAMQRITRLPHEGSATDARYEALDHFHCRKTPSFSEVLASLIILLPEFVELLTLADVPTWDDPVNLSNHIAHLIVGSTLYQTRPFLSEIISGSVDADKLDYMPRDCFSAGLPMPVDIERLLQKLQAVAISGESDLGRSWAEFCQLPLNQPIYMMAIDERGGIAAEELVVSRVLLYNKLYHHQKVRVFEGLVERALDLLIEGVPAFSSPATFLTMTDDDFLEKRWPNGDNAVVVDRAKELVRRIRDRHEMVRSIAFGPSMIESPPENATIAWAKLQPFVSRDRTEESVEFLHMVVTKAKEYLRTVGDAARADTLTEDLVIVDLPDPQGISEKTRFLVGNEQTGLRQYSEVARVDRWAEAYETDKSIGYVYSPPEHAVAVHMAVCAVFENIAGIVLEDRQLTLTKILPDELLAFRNLLIERGTDVPEIRRPQGWQQVVPLAERSELSVKFGPILAELARRFQSYQPVGGAAVDVALLTNFLLQFARDDVPLVIKVLENIQFWTRERLADAFRSYLAAMRYEHVQLVALGGPTTSAELLQYIMNDVKVDLPLEVTVLGSIESVEKALPVVFFDDFIGSGLQSSTVLQQWSGVPEADWFVSEKHVEGISPEARERLRTCELTFLFAAGRRSGLQRLCDTAQTLFERPVTGWIVQPQDLSCFAAAANVFSRHDDAERGQAVFSNAARRALSDEPWDQQKVEDRLLGYGNSADLNVFFYNTPSSTLTALWKKCEKPDAPWLPLFLRRKRN